MFIRELIYQNLMPVYRFYGATLKILNVPIAIPFGWLFAIYISLYVSEYIFGSNLYYEINGDKKITNKEYSTKILPIIFVACVLMTTVTFAIENTAVNMQWWGDPDVEGTQRYLNPGWLGGWMMTCLWFSTLIIYITYPKLRLKRNLLLVIFIWLAILITEPRSLYYDAFSDIAWFDMVYQIGVNIVIFSSLLLWKQYTIFYLVLTFGLVFQTRWTLDLIPDIPGIYFSLIFMAVLYPFGYLEYKFHKPKIQINPRHLL